MRPQRRNNPILATLLASLIFLPLTLSAGSPEIPDSLLTKSQIYKYTFTDSEKARQIIRLMRERNLEEDFVLDIAEGDLLSNNGRYREALNFYNRALKNQSVIKDAEEYMDLLHRLISCYDGLHNDEKEAECVQLLLDKAEQCGNRAMKSVALFNMGKMIYYQQDKQRGYDLIKEAIEIMEGSDYKNKYYNLRYNYNTLLMMQQRDGQYGEALETLENLEHVLNKATSDQLSVDGLDKKEKKTLLAWRAVILAFLGRLDEADKAYEEWTITGRDYTQDDYLITSYLLERKQFDRVIEIYGPREDFLRANNDTINYHMRTLKRLLGRAYEGRGDYRKAAKYYEELALLTDSLKVREQESAAVELATVYDTHQKEVKLQEQRTHIRVRNLLLISAGIVILLLGILLWRNILHFRVIRYKNRRMTTTIGELLAQKDELFEAKEELNALKAEKKKQELSKHESPSSDFTSADNNSTPEDQTLFETLDNLVVREKLYLKPDLSREDLMKLIGVNKNRFAQIIQQCTGNGTSAYINNKRLEYAARLLRTNREYTIAAIADLCGTPNVPTFNRLFKAKFGMTPAEFRSNM